MISAKCLMNSDGMSLKPTAFLNPRALIILKVSVGPGGLRYMDEPTRVKRNFEMVLKLIS